MGFLRLFLALDVLDWHYQYSDAIFFPHSFVAVCCFFIISGFYMSMVLNEKYEMTTRGLGSFYANRAARLYPTNIAVWLLYGLAIMFGVAVPVHLSWAGWANQLLIFPDVLWKNITLNPRDFTLIFGQLATVGLEMIFYLLAPFIVTRKFGMLVAATLMALMLHLGFHRFGLPSRPWQYEFFPGIMWFFLLGALSYRLFKAIEHYEKAGLLGIFFLPLLMVYFTLIRPESVGDFTNSAEMLCLYLFFAAGIPFLFLATRRSAIDRAIGDLSYPLYAVHFAVGLVITGHGPSPDVNRKADALVLLVSLLCAGVLAFGVERPVDKIRARLVWRRPSELGPVGERSRGIEASSL